MLSLLARQELPLRQIEERFDMTRPAVIKHLRVLKSCRLVQTRRRGRQVFHRLNARPLAAIREWLEEYEVFWDTHLSRLKQQVESAP
jgi:DNA-binding transcriptional ArsR family regulator